MKFLFLFFIFLGLTVDAFADVRLFELYRQQEMSKQSLGEADKRWSVEEWRFDQKLDHNNSADSRTFEQLYYTHSQFAKDNSSPVLLYICGESACHPNKSILEHAEKLNAHVVFVEHRYYGKSIPFNYLSTENLKYLSTDFALKDLAAIQLYLQKDRSWTGKWIAIGGSYAGSLAAYYRLKYPELVVGALASSGPVMAKENFEEYDLHVSKVVGPSCGKKMKEVVSYIESNLDNKDALNAIKKQFKGELLHDDVDFLYLVADMGAFAVQYGSVDRFCELVDSAEPLKGYAAFTREIFALYGMTALDLSAAGAIDPNLQSTSVGMRQWFYQSCTEYGYWQNAYHDEAVSVRSKLINSEYHKNICKRLFGLDIASNENYINEKFYYPLLLSDYASNIFFTNGSEDPWINLSIAVENTNDINTKNPTLTMKGAYHCDDLHISKDEAVLTGRKKFLEFAHKWLE